MENDELIIKELLNEKNNLEKQIEEANFKGYPEIKILNGKKYIYIRSKKYNHLSSKYISVYDEKYFNELKELSKTIRELNNKLKKVKTKLAKLNIDVNEINHKILLNIDYVRNNMNIIIYGQAIVEGVSATFLDTEEIIENGSSANVNFNDTLTILNLKNAWEYILDEDTYRRDISFDTLANIAGFVNDRQINNPSEIRKTDVRIGGCAYIPPIPRKDIIVKNINQIINSDSKNLVKKAINLFCYLTKAQVFRNGNKRTSLIFANLYLISKGLGYLSIPSEIDKEFKQLLVEYYDNKNNKVKDFLFNKCYFKL